MPLVSNEITLQENAVYVEILIEELVRTYPVSNRISTEKGWMHSTKGATYKVRHWRPRKIVSVRRVAQLPASDKGAAGLGTVVVEFITRRGE